MADELAELSNAQRARVPLKELSEKWKLVPAFLRLRGLVKQHIDSFNHFLNIELKQIIRANELIQSEYDPNFFFRFTDIHVGKPQSEENAEILNLMPQECRVRDMTYSAAIHVDVEYTKGG